VHLARALAVPTFAAAGASHFLRPAAYAAIVPDWLPAHRALVLASGAAEVAFAVGLLHRRSRRLAGIGLGATLVAVFPANVHMALHPRRYRLPGGRATLLARVPLQLVFLAWVRAAARDRPYGATAAPRSAEA
jgi:uncharacterized membrane protein